MAPKGQTVIRGGRVQVQEKGYAKTVFDEVTSADNRQVLTAVGLFAVGVAFLHSSFSEILLPP